MGGKPIGSFQSATFNELIHKYVIPATDSNDFFIGDFVKTVETSENGVPICVLADATDPIRGIIAGFEADHDYEDRTYRLGNIRRTAYVCDDPDIEIEIQASGTLTSTDIGKNATILYAAGNATTGLSGTLLDTSTLTPLAGQLKIVRMADTPLSELGEYTKVYCKIVDHELAQGGTVQSFLKLTDTPGIYNIVHQVYKVNAAKNAVVEATMTCDDSGNVNIPGKLTVVGAIDPTALLLDPQGSPPFTTDGTLYYATTEFQFRENGAWTAHTDFALLAGRSGGQTLQGGTAASENLVLDSTAHATKGEIQMPTGNTLAVDNIKDFSNGDMDIAATGDVILQTGTGQAIRAKNTRQVQCYSGAASAGSPPASLKAHANYIIDQDFTVSGGSATGTLGGSATVGSQQLLLNNDDSAYVTYDGTSNADFPQTGALRAAIIPNYSGNPSTDQTFMCVSKAAGDSDNLMRIRHLTNGQIQVRVFDSTGSFIINSVSLGVFNPTIGILYDIEFNYDLTGGASRLFIAGSQLGSTQTQTGTRDSSIDFVCLGDSPNLDQTANFRVDYFSIYNAVQHTTNYTPDSGEFGSDVLGISFMENNKSGFLRVDADSSLTESAVHALIFEVRNSSNLPEKIYAITENYLELYSGKNLKSNGTIEGASGTAINEFSTDGTLAGDSDDAIPTEKAVKTYISNTNYTKDEVDDLLGGVNFDYFFTDTADPIIAGYNEMLPSDTGEAESTIALAIPAADTLITSFVTEANEPEFINLLEGIYDIHIHAAKTAGTEDAFIYGEFYKRASGGSETLLSTSESSSNLTGSNVEYDLHFSIAADELLASDDRLVIKMYGSPSGAGSTPTVTLYLEGTNDSRVEVKTDAGFLEEKFLVKNGLSGGQTAVGGTDASDNLILESTSDATKGEVQIADGTVLHTNTANYETLVTDDDDFPNKKYLDDQLPVKKVFSFAATAGQTSFTLPTTPPTPTLVTAFRNGTQAIYTTEFTVSGNTLTWVAPTLFLNERISGFYNDTGVSYLVGVTTKSASDTAALEDAEHIIEYTNGASDYAFTLPQNSDVAFPIGSWIEIRRTGSGEITITKGTGATFRGALGDVNVKIDGADGYSSFIEKTATNTWLISGSVKAV